ncbi:MAG: FAD/NAD(P)-binding protein, partial [Myxococcota bacterium]
MQRVAIIGAGPAGLAAAASLRERRVPRITVFERHRSVGGQCRSREIDERAYDLGASITTPRCSWVRDMAEQLGMTRRMVERRRIVDVSGASPT